MPGFSDPDGAGEKRYEHAWDAASTGLQVGHFAKNAGGRPGKGKQRTEVVSERDTNGALRERDQVQNGRNT